MIESGKGFRNEKGRTMYEVKELVTGGVPRSSNRRGEGGTEGGSGVKMERILK